MMLVTRNNLIATWKQLQVNFITMKNIVKSSCSASSFTNKHNLPSLPLPKLEDTFNKYIKSVQPFLNETELSNTKVVIENFMKTNAPNLQSFLEKRSLQCENWLSEWWDNVAYLEYRDPVTVFSSPGLVFPLQQFSNENEQLEYAAKLILAAMDYKFLIDRDAIPLEKMGKDPLDMNQYKKIYGTCRIPAAERDILEFNSASKHIVVVKNNHFFKLKVVGINDEVPNFHQLVAELSKIVDQSKSETSPIGILSSDNRDNWSTSYKILSQDSSNKQNIREIEKSLFLLCLDKEIPNLKDKKLTVAAKQCIHGGGLKGNSGNRWFDKTVQFIVGADGIVGLTYEHSPSEGQPIAVLTDYLVKYVNGENWKKFSNASFDFQTKNLQFKIFEEIIKAIKTASNNVDKLANNLELNVFKFDSYGKEFVKSQKFSPDSFIQIAMQYAFYRYHRTPAAHYESAATRKYIHGRTETIRSCSLESIAFAKAMLESSISNSDRVNALKSAINSHKNYTIEAINGFGVDRHLLGLKMAAKELKIDLPEVFKDVAYTRSTHMRLSTSQVATRCDGVMAYGPLVPNGYGCCYNPRPNDIYFAVSCFLDNRETSCDGYRQALEDSLIDMHDLLAKTQKSKL